MEDYNKESSCIKCQEAGASTKYVVFKGLEFFERVCKNCGFLWREKPTGKGE